MCDENFCKVFLRLSSPSLLKSGAVSQVAGLVRMKASLVLAITCSIALNLTGQSLGLQVTDNDGETCPRDHEMK